MNADEMLLTSLLKCRRVDLYTNPIKLDSARQKVFDNLKRRYVGGEPLQYILGECEFYGMTLKVDERVLIPRPETELLVDLILDTIPYDWKLFPIIGETVSKYRGKCPQGQYLRILDLGTGSGNIAIALAKHLPESRLVSVDISREALHLARTNAMAQGVEHRIDFINADLKDFLQKQSDQNKTFDVIISNPPYIPTSQLSSLPQNVQREPVLALDGGEDGLKFYRAIVPAAELLLSSQGFLFFEIGDGQSFDILRLFSNQKFAKVHALKDFSGTDRFILAQL